MPIAKPTTVFQASVAPDWCDFNGHLTQWQYGKIFSDATLEMFSLTDLGEAYLGETGNALFTTENHTWYLRECKSGGSIRVDIQFMELGTKAMHLGLALFDEANRLCARDEQLLLHVNRDTHGAVRSAAFPEEAVQRIRPFLSTSRENDLGSHSTVIRLNK